MRTALDPRLWWKRSILTLLSIHVISQNWFCLILPPSQRRAMVTFDPNKPVSLKSNHELPPRMSWITNPPIVCLWGAVPLLLCCGSRTLPFNVIRITNPLFRGHTLGFGKKHIQGQNLRKKSGSRKTWRMGPPEKKLKHRRKNTFSIALPFSRIFQIQTFFDEIVKNRNRGKIRRKTSYMLRLAMQYLVCFGERIHPQCDIWYGSIS